MTIKNLVVGAALNSVFNTGVPASDLSKKKIKGVIFLDRGVEFTGADIASVPAFIQAIKDATLAARGSRAYPIWDLLNIEDTGGDPQSGGIGNLTTAQIIVSDAVPSFRFGYAGTEIRHSRVSALMGMSLDVLFVDEGFTVYGTEGASGGFAGFNVQQAYADTSKFPISDAVNQYAFRVTLADVTEYRDNSVLIKANNGLLAALGLVNITLSELSRASNAIKLLMIADGGTNMEPDHGATLDGLTWTATNLETGAAVTVTSVATSPSDDSMLVTLDSTQWTALATGDKVQIDGPTPAAMAAVGIKPFEFLPVVIEK